MPTKHELDPVLGQVAADVRRVVNRLRPMSAAQLGAPAPPYSSRADAGRAAARALADAAQGIEQAVNQPPWRDLPELSDFAVGDMVAVTGHDLLEAARAADSASFVWTRRGQVPVAEVLAELAAVLVAVRRAI